MTRVFALILAAALLFSGCQAAMQPEVEYPFSFYYLRVLEERSEFQSPDGALGAEIRDVDPERLDLEQLLGQYLLGPSTQSLQSPFPDTLTVKGCRLQNGLLTITFGDEYAALSGIRLSEATACLIRTFSQVDGVDAVYIQTESGMLSGQERTILKQENFLYSDESDQLFEESVFLYFSDVAGKYLLREPRTEEFVAREDIPEYILKELSAGPASDAARWVIPEGTRVLSLKTEDGICTVDLSREFLERIPITTEEALVRIYAIVNSLTALDWISGVRILVCGAPLREYGTLLLPDVLEFSQNLIGG